MSSNLPQRLDRAMRQRILPTVVVALLACASANAAGDGGQSVSKGTWLAELEVPFVANEGALDERVACFARTFAGTVFVTHGGEVVYSLAAAPRADAATARWSLVQRFVGGAARPTLSRAATARVALFHGADERRWQRDSCAWSEVEFGEVWPGIEVRLQARADNVEQLFELAPGADVARIRIELDGARDACVASDGTLALMTDLGEVTWTAPLAFQLDEQGEREGVHVAYHVEGSSYGFVLGAYDPQRPVVIDPLLRSTYLGGSQVETMHAIALTPNEVYVAGMTLSDLDFPGTLGGAQPTSGGWQDAFIARLSRDLSTLHQATYYGGSSYERICAIAVTPTEIVVAGDTASTDLPGTGAGAFPSAIGGGDAFLARFTRDLTSQLSATYFGGTAQDELDGLGTSLTQIGNDWLVAGWTTSTNLPTFSNSAQPALAGTSGVGDTFVVRLSADLSTLQGATYLGGSNWDLPGSVAVLGNSVYVGGNSLSADFPGTTGSAQPHLAGQSDAYVAKFDPFLTQLQRASYVGGSGNENAGGSCVVASGASLYIGGLTNSTDLPSSAGGAQPTKSGGGVDAFVARLSADLSSIQRSTYFGSSGDEFPTALLLLNGELVLAGSTTSSSLPASSLGAQPVSAGGYDAFLVRLSSDLSVIARSTLLGGSLNDTSTAIAGDAHDLYLVGGAFSTNLPATTGAYQPAYNGGNGFCSRFTADLGGACGTTSYCTSSTSTTGCVPTMSASGTFSTAASSGFVVSCSQLPGQRAALVFYGISGTQSVQWAPASTSFLCVKLPTQRTLLQTSGGTAGACDGNVSLDLLAFLAANPGALGHPLTAGQAYQFQTWYRDAAAPKTTNLSDALNSVLCP